MKKFALLLTLLFLVTSGAFAMSVADTVDEEDKTVVNNEDTTKPGYYDKQLVLARKHYFNGELAKAEDICDKIVIAQPENEAAAILQNKIVYLKQKEVLYKKSLVDTYYVELRKSVMEGNCYDGFMYLKKIGELEQGDKLNYFINVLTMEKENILSRFNNKKDKNTFLKSLDAFVDGDFVKSTKLLYKLQEKYPQFSIYLSISRAKEFNEENDDRMNELYKKTLKSLQKNEFVKAKNYAQLLYMMDYNNITAKLLLDQVELEIED